MYVPPAHHVRIRDLVCMLVCIQAITNIHRYNTHKSFISDARNTQKSMEDKSRHMLQCVLQIFVNVEEVND
jgi:hypothetical protein